MSMSQSHVSHEPTQTPSPSLLRRSWRFNRSLTLGIALHIALIPLLFIGMLVDPKVITGMNGWIKPLKFAISSAVYCATFFWMLQFVDSRKRFVQAIATVTGLGLLIETGLITVQVIRGVTSHFNVSTVFDTTIFLTMGGIVALVAVANIVLAALLVIQRHEQPRPVVTTGLRWGLIASIVGMSSGVLMASQQPSSVPSASLPVDAATQTADQQLAGGAHSVGVTDGGPGLPLVGWSTEGGDLRVGHFVGLHAMQVLPFLAFLLGMPWATRRLSERRRAGLVRVAGASYTVLTGLLIWQALRAQPLIAPDALTWAVLAVWAIATTAAALRFLVPRGSSLQRYAKSTAVAVTHPAPWP